MFHLIRTSTPQYQRAFHTAPSLLYRNNLKNREFDQEAPQIFDSERATIAEGQGASENREFDQEAPQIFDSERATIAEGQGASENRKFEVRPTQPKTDSSGCFGINNKASYLELLQTIFVCKHLYDPSFRDPDFIARTPPLFHNWRTREMGEKWAKELIPYQSALSQVVEKTVGKHAPECESMLEVGSGRFPITHFLPNTRNKDQIHLSDVNAMCLHQLRKTHPENPIRRVDLLSPNQTSLTYKTIVMSDVLNIFSPEELSKALESVHRLLDPGGRLLHFSVREQIFSHTLDALRMDHKSCLPMIDKDSLWNGVYVIDRNHLPDFIFAQKTDLVRKILLEYFSLGSLLQNDMCIELIGHPELELFSDLSESIEKCEGLVTQKILFEEEYRNTLELELDKRNFTVLEFGDVEGEYRGPKTEEQEQMWPNCNTFCIKRICQMCMKDPMIPRGKAFEHATVHVLVAQK